MPQTIQSDTAQLHPQTPSPEISLMTSRLYTAPAVSLVGPIADTLISVESLAQGPTHAFALSADVVAPAMSRPDSQQ